MGTEKAKVTVVMSTYNRAERFLSRAIQSVLNQSYRQFELLVVDDCSTDNTKEVVESFVKKDARVKYLCLEKNHGKDTKPKNTGVMNAQGDYIAYLDDDNEWESHHLAVLVAEIEKHKVDVVYAVAQMYNADDPAALPTPTVSMEFDPQVLMRKNYIDTSVALHTRESIFRVGGWDETLPRFVDWNLWVRMAKAGMRFKRVPLVTVKYYTHKNNSAKAYESPQWVDPVMGPLFQPTFDPAGCFIYLPYLGDTYTEEKTPRVAIYTLSYDRLDYTKQLWKGLQETAEYPFDWFVIDQGSKDGSKEYLEDLITQPQEGDGTFEYLYPSPENLGITGGSNHLVDEVMRHATIQKAEGAKGYQIIIKIDNDCQFMTKGWLSSIVDLWKRNHKLYMSPYVEGLVHNPGGASRVGHAFIGPYLVEVTKHIGGIFAAVDASAYRTFRWQDQFLHGLQDAEASAAFVEDGFMPCYIPLHRVMHIDSTEGQHKKYPEYFERRKQEKTKTYEKER